MREYRAGLLRTDKEHMWKDDWVTYYEVEKGGLFSLDDFYMFMFQWFQKEMFQHWQGDKNIEDFYLHRIRGDGVQENLIWWRAVKRLNAYTSYMCKMDWQNFGSKETEIAYNDKKIKTDKVGLVVRVWWWVQHDPENRWDKSFMGHLWHGHFVKWFYHHLNHKEMEYHRDKCRMLARRQEDEMKQFFELTTTIAMPRSFFPEEGYKWKKPPVKPEDFTHNPRRGDVQSV